VPQFKKSIPQGLCHFIKWPTLYFFH